MTTTNEKNAAMGIVLIRNGVTATVVTNDTMETEVTHDMMETEVTHDMMETEVTNDMMPGRMAVPSDVLKGTTIVGRKVRRIIGMERCDILARRWVRRRAVVGVETLKTASAVWNVRSKR
jgi:hypothetical protein